MTEAFIANFLTEFDDSRFPEAFLQRFEALECLSESTLGETLLVKDRQSGDLYVAKCYSNQTLLSLPAENKLLKKLDHEGLPRFVGEFENHSMRCVVRTFARGTTLIQFVKENRLTPHQAVEIAIQLCDILSYLHGQTPAIIHRDIKPQNIIIDDQGKVTLIDFGISRAYKEDLNEDTLCFGTRYFAAPEQYGFSQTDCRADIFSLGVLLCWLLTGSVDVQQAGKTIPNTRLAGVIAKCTAFAPKDRYQSTVQVKDALTGRALRRKGAVFFSVALFLILAVFSLGKSISLPVLGSDAGTTFKEPLIEEAVRLTLGKGAADEISEQDLLSVTELFVFGDQAAKDEEAFNVSADHFVENDGVVLRGSIQSLDDLTRLRNLRRVSLVYQNITDLAPLAQLPYLEWLELHHNPIEDVSPLSQVPSLVNLGLFDTQFSDLTALNSCPHLSVVDVGFTNVTSTAAFDGLDALQKLVIRKAPLQSLTQIETHPMLEEIYLSETQLLDLSPLLQLPRLRVVEVSDNMRNAAEVVEEQAQFEIVFP